MTPIKQFTFNLRLTGGIPFEIFPIESREDVHDIVLHPHRDTFYLMLWIEAGAGTYTIDFIEYHLQPGMFFCISPGQVHYWNVSEPLRGMAIPFLLDLFIDQTYPRFPQDFNIFDWNTEAGYQIPPEAQARLRILIQLLVDEYTYSSVSNQQSAIRHALLLMLMHVQRVVTPSSPTAQSSGNALLHQFMQLVNVQYLTQRQVQDYADSLGVSAGHLSDTVSDLTGLTAISIIHQRTLLEAKRLLIHTDQPINQIAISLSFNDSSYFGRFFRRMTDETPQQFRQRFR
jgi:AraC family transcriptional activator of pobA